MKEGRSRLVIILVSIIIILVIIVGYGIYTGIKVKAELNKLNAEKQDLKTSLDELQEDYDLLRLDVQKIYQSCINEGVCKGHFPEVSWYCNNVGDAVNDPSHICVCDSSCAMTATAI